jgi:hypothetical protein
MPVRIGDNAPQGLAFPKVITGKNSPFPNVIRREAELMSSDIHLAHRIAAGFLEHASSYAARAGEDDWESAMQEALANLRTEVLEGANLDERMSAAGFSRDEREAVLLACQIATATLNADTRTVN